MKKRILMIGAGKGLSISIRLLQKDKKLKICGFIPRLDKNFKIYKKEFFTPHKYNFPVYKIKNINEEKILIKLRKMKIDLICCWGYNRLLTKNLLNISKLGCLNLHPGLLPYGRGTGALVGEILNNSQYLGQTCHLMNEKFDSGEIISVRKMKFSGDEYLNEITKKLDYKTPEFFVKSIYKCLSNKFKRKKMKSFGRYFPKLSPSDEIVDWNKNSSYILKKIRSRSPELLSKSYILPSKKVFFY